MRYQKGMSFSSVAALVALAAVLLKAAFTLVPMYWDNKMVSTILDTMVENGEIKDDTKPGQLKKLIEHRLSSNNLNISVAELKITEEKRGLTIDWPYEVRGTWIGEIDLVVRFHQHKEF
ncbi:DUF4845 domain-containing protein [Thalassolituus sp. LLYu03]|uniref:DUF4845 domain-containing protein n=1 Tax=Thalassolituus sp. LLYu03 TaxID=3421656 RepID=UPI003D2ACACB